MVHRLLRLFCQLLPAVIIFLMWMAWLVMPVRPVREWLIPGAFGLHDSKIDPLCTQAITTTHSNPLHPSAYVAHPDTDFFTGPAKSEQRRLDLTTGQTSPVNKFVGGMFESRDLKYSAETNGEHWTIIDKSTNTPTLTIPIPSGREVKELMPWFSYQPNGQLLAISHGKTAEIEMWALTDRKLTLRITDANFPWIFSSDGKLLAVTSANRNTVRVHDAENGQVIGTAPSSDLHVWSLAFSPRHELMIFRSQENKSKTLVVEAWAPRQQTWRGSFTVLYEKSPPRVFQNVIKFSANGQLVFLSGVKQGYLHDLDAQPPRCLDAIIGDKSADMVIAPVNGGVSVLDRASQVWSIRDISGGNDRAMRRCGPGAVCADPQVSPNNDYVAIGRRNNDNGLMEWIMDFLKRNLAWQVIPSSEYRLIVFDSRSGRRATEVDSWCVDRWTPDGNHFWTSDTVRSPDGKPAGITYRLWSANTSTPPWWLWAMTSIGVLWYFCRFVRTRRVHSGRLAPPARTWS